MNLKTRGSEWNKWDLHIHTPFSYLHSNYGNDWDNYVKKLFLKAIKKEIKVIGITDYFTIEGYKKIRNEYLNNQAKLQTLFTQEEIDIINKILVLPNIEFRLDQLVNGNRVNFHVLFSEEVSIRDIEENFLHELDFVYEGAINSEDEKWKLKSSNLIDFGKKLKSEHPNFKSDSDVFVGMKCAVVNHTQISDLLTNKKSKFKNNYLLVTPSDEDLSQIDWNGQGHNIRKILIQKSNVLFASNNSTIKWALGKFGTQEEYIKEFKSLKPVIWGSDAHDYDKMFEPSNNRYCWIKAQLTFNGLRQILFEPEDRVYIGESKPEQKNSYNTIDSIQFIDNDFSPELIPINSNLVTIIGGKSTGKSLLLRNIAKAIDPNEVQKRLDECNIQDYKRKIDNFSVTWSDNQTQSLGSDGETNKKIIYIPQSYLNRLVEKPESTSSIDEIITGVLRQEPTVDNAFDQLEDLERNNQKSISHEVNDIFYLLEDISKQYEKIKEVGDEKGITEEIKRLNNEITELKKKSGLSEEEIIKYNSGISSINDKQNEINNISQNNSRIDYYKGLSLFNNTIIDGFIGEIGNELNKSLEEIKTELSKRWSTILDTEKGKINSQINSLNNEIATTNKGIESLMEKVKSYHLLNEKLEKHKSEDSKLKTILKLKDERKSNIDKLKEKINYLIKIHKSYFDNLVTIKDRIIRDHKIDSELEFNININFKKSIFQSSFIETVLNQKHISKYTDVKLNQYEYSSNTNFESDVEKIVKSLLLNKIVLKNNYSNKEAILKLLNNWYIFDFQIKQNGDNISEMSPGKKSFVLLKLLIELDNSKCPILLDQPEDDLDNRSIYNDLVSFVRDKKKERQIIIATHNPNLVVSSDSEQVIVANQQGDKSQNRLYKFEYVSGALEDSFLNTDEDITLEKQGIQEHVCDILEGGIKAFKTRSDKYNIT